MDHKQALVNAAVGRGAFSAVTDNGHCIEYIDGSKDCTEAGRSEEWRALWETRFGAAPGVSVKRSRAFADGVAKDMRAARAVQALSSEEMLRVLAEREFGRVTDGMAAYGGVKGFGAVMGVFVGGILLVALMNWLARGCDRDDAGEGNAGRYSTQAEADRLNRYITKPDWGNRPSVKDPSDPGTIPPPPPEEDPPSCPPLHAKFFIKNGFYYTERLRERQHTFVNCPSGGWTMLCASDDLSIFPQPVQVGAETEYVIRCYVQGAPLAYDVRCRELQVFEAPPATQCYGVYCSY
jgi:hypothetical protein